MFTPKDLRKSPDLIKAFMGLPAPVFWQLIAALRAKMPEYEQQRLDRPARQRAVGGGRAFDQPLVIRVALVLTYLRLHIPQEAVAKMYGATQSDVSRELRRVLPLLREVLPCPAVWEVLEAGAELSATETQALEEWLAGHVLVDATEQVVERPQENEERKEYYSGKHKHFTLKTQIVTDSEHHITALSEAVPGAMHDKTLSDQVHTLERVPEGSEVDADKGYQGLDKQVEMVTVRNPETGEEQQVPRVTVRTPHKQPKGGELTEEQKAFNQQLSSLRVRVEHCIGWIKNWAIIRTRFRCAHDIYTLIMQVVWGFVNQQTQRWQAARAAATA